MEKKKSKQFIFERTTTITLLVLYILIQVCCLLFERDFWGLITGVKNPKMLGLGWTLLISLGVTILYLGVYVLRIKHITNILVVKCDPMQFYDRINGAVLKQNENAKIQNKLTCNFYAGNWDSAKEQCFDILTHSKNIPHILEAYSIMLQIYLMEGDIVNLVALRDSTKPFMNDPKFGQQFTKIYEMADMYFDYMIGDGEKMVKKYTKMLEETTQPANKYIIKFYLAMAVACVGDANKTVEMLKDIMENANKLFVAKNAKEILLTLMQF